MAREKGKIVVFLLSSSRCVRGEEREERIGREDEEERGVVVSEWHLPLTQPIKAV